MKKEPGLDIRRLADVVLVRQRGVQNVYVMHMRALGVGLNNKGPANVARPYAPPQGLEPWTYGLTVRRSNQLS